MNPNSHNDSSGQPAGQLDALGSEVFNCRRLPVATSLRAQGFLFAWLLYYVFLPFAILPYLSAMTVLFGFFLCGFALDEIPRSTFLVVFLVLYITLLACQLILPRYDHLALHNRGFCIRKGFKRRTILFDSIDHMFAGRIPSKAELAIRSGLGVIRPSQARWMNEWDGTALTVVSKDGQVHVFKGVLVRFEPDDLQRFFDEFIERNPHLGENTRTDEQQVPEKSTKPGRSPAARPLVAVIVMAIASLVLVFIFVGLEDSTRSQAKEWSGTFHIKAPQPEIQTLPVRPGDKISVRITLIKGELVNIHLGQVTKREGKALVIQGVGLEKATKVGQFNVDSFVWSHNSPAVVIIASEGESDVGLSIKIEP